MAYPLKRGLVGGGDFLELLISIDPIFFSNCQVGFFAFLDVEGIFAKGIFASKSSVIDVPLFKGSLKYVYFHSG